MSSPLKPITLWGQGGPNPPKVAIILEELHIPYHITPLPLSDVKTPSYLAINPNGRLPAIHDPNTALTLWESGAILEYLVERYDDPARRLSFEPGTPESYHAKQWLHFQASGQGPYYGQAAWFKKYHPEPVPSAAERYVKEVNRVSGVLDGYLAGREREHGGAGGGGDGPWLVGDKLSYADIAFVPWQRAIGRVLGKEEYDEDDFPHLKEWLGRMTSRDSVKTVLESAQH
ncbi:MAG: hypothetical protein Q9161_002695 [Pseudevernia consocians]